MWDVQLLRQPAVNRPRFLKLSNYYQFSYHIIVAINRFAFIATAKIGLFSLPLSDVIISWLDFNSSPFIRSLRSLFWVALLVRLVVLSGFIDNSSGPGRTRKSMSLLWESWVDIFAGLFDECVDERWCEDELREDFFSSSLFLRGDESSLDPDFLWSLDLVDVDDDLGDGDDFDLSFELGLLLLDFDSTFSLFRRLRGSRSSMFRDLPLFDWLNFGILGRALASCPPDIDIWRVRGCCGCCTFKWVATVFDGCGLILISLGSRERAEIIIDWLTGAIRTRPWWWLGGIWR